MCVAQLRAFGGKDQIAGHHHFQTARHRQPVHCGDHRFRAMSHKPKRVIDKIQKIRLAWCMFGASNFFQIGTGAECPARAGQDNCTHPIVGQRRFQCCRHLAQHLR